MGVDQCQDVGEEGLSLGWVAFVTALAVLESCLLSTTACPTDWHAGHTGDHNGLGLFRRFWS